jgi:hypothetical protein
MTLHENRILCLNHVEKDTANEGNRHHRQENMEMMVLLHIFPFGCHVQKQDRRDGKNQAADAGNPYSRCEYPDKKINHVSLPPFYFLLAVIIHNFGSNGNGKLKTI